MEEDGGAESGEELVEDGGVEGFSAGGVEVDGFEGDLSEVAERQFLNEFPGALGEVGFCGVGQGEDVVVAFVVVLVFVEGALEEEESAFVLDGDESWEVVELDVLEGRHGFDCGANACVRLVGEDVEGDDAQDGEGQKGGGGDEEERGVGAEGGERVGGELAEFGVAAPGAEGGEGADDECGQG